MQKGLIGLDLGTTTIKAVLMDEQGKLLATASREYTLETTIDRCEIDAVSYWNHSIATIRALIESATIPVSAIQGISFSSQGETLICLDEHGEPLRKAIVWLDNRSNEEGREIWDFFGRDEINRITGQTEVLPFWTAARISWLRKHEPAVFKKVRKFLLVEDYIIYKLTGVYASDQSLNSSTVYYDIYKKQWWKEMLAFLEISEDHLPTVHASGEKIAVISKRAAAACGLPDGLFVIAGTFDHVAGAIGAGNIRGGMISETTGASMAMVVTLDAPIENIPFNLPVQCHAIAGKYLMLPYAQTAGMMFRWFRDTFCEMEMLQAADKNQDAYELMTAQARGIPAGSDGLLILPHLMGSGSPEFNAKAKSVFAGIQMGMVKAHFLRAIMESIAFMIKRNIEILESKGIGFTEIRVLGGGAKSPLWNQIKSDVTNIPIITLHGEETTSVGAAILAGVGCGIFSDIEDGCRKTVKEKDRYFPDLLYRDIYATQYARYKLLSDSLESFW
jgi:sugar (pentulose or hexulose) kinase